MVRVNPEKKEEKERVGHALLRATLQLAAAHGFASLGLREVSRAADIAPTSFYRHFADMEELGLKLVEQLVGQLVASWIEAAQGARGAHAALEALCARALASAGEDPELMRFMLAERVGALPKFRAALTNKLSPVSESLHSAFAAEPAAAANLVELAPSALVLLLEACAEALDAKSEQLEPLRARVVRHITRLLGAAPGQTP